MEYVLFGKDGKEAVVKTATDKAEYLASGFYSEKPYVLKSETVIKEDAAKDESEAVVEGVIEEDDIRELYFQKFGRKAGNMSDENIKAKLAE